MADLDVAKIGRALRSYATHHNHGDGWTYTRDLGGMRHIRYSDDWKGRFSVVGRVSAAWQAIFPKPHSVWAHDPWWRGPHRISMLRSILRVHLGTETHLPDGALNNGIVITVWEEDGEYIEWVGPTVGSKIADFLEADPNSPHAIAIASEMHRVRQLGIDRRKAEREAS